MKNPIAAAVCASVLFTGGALQAQSSLAPHMRGDVPFVFQVGDQIMPPGSYTIKVDTTARHILLRHNDTNTQVMLVGLPGGGGWQTAPQSIMRFENYGGRHVLRELVREGEQNSFELPVPRSAQRLAGNAKPSEMVVIALTRPPVR